MQHNTDEFAYKVINIIIFIGSIFTNVLNEDIINYAKINIDSEAVGHSL